MPSVSRPMRAIATPTLTLAAVAASVLLTASSTAAQPRVGSTTVVTPTDQGATAAISVTTTGPRYHPTRLFVRFKPGARDFLPGSVRARGFRHDRDLFLVDVPTGVAVDDAVRRYKGRPTVEYAEPDYEVTAVTTNPTDPQWGGQWDMAKIAAPLAWDTQTSAAGVVVAIIDTGIDFTHPDLAGNVSAAGSFNCIGGTCVTGGQDDHGHGTHVAGTIGAVANNGIGIAGLNWNVQMIAMKFLNSGGSGNISDAVAAFDKILELKTNGVNIRVTNNSWGGGGYSQALKDAMAAVEAAGVVNVCAAGNSGVNADVVPMYPGAYANRGIISVAATDGADVGAYFTNYGLAAVDIAAPGVSTLSTVPTGPCSLCDPSGYRTLSGTSMAAPHVTGVVAALMKLNPALTAAQARDVLLDPASYDAVADARASSTSTGGRLNFNKAIHNPKLLSPGALNNFPTLTLGPDQYVTGGASVSLSASASDADNDALRLAWGKNFDTTQSWMLGWMGRQIFPDAVSNPTTFTAPVVGMDALAPYLASAADNRGGGASAIQNIIVSQTGGLQPPVGTLTASTLSAAAGSTITFNFSPTDPDAKGQPAYDIFASYQYGLSGWCCYTGSGVGITFNSAGVYRVGVQAMDRSLQSSADRQSVVVSIGGAAGTPPIARAVLDRTSGAVPFTVNVDMSTSTDPDGTISYYFVNCGAYSAAGTSNPKGQCTYTTPGNYWLELMVMDNNNLMDVVNMYVVATPGGVQAPSNVTATAATDVVNLAWTAASGATGYGVRRATTPGGPYTQTFTGIGGTSFSDNTVANGTKYYYVVYATGSGPASGNSAEVSATPIGVPAGVSASAANGPVAVSWSAAAGAASYLVKRSLTSGGGYSVIASGVAGTTFADAAVSAGTTYYYIVAGANSSGQGSDSAYASATPIAAPTGVTATAGEALVALTWTPVSGATKYTVKRSTSSGGPFVAVPAGMNIATASFLDSGLTNGTTYYYVIQAANVSATSADSASVSARPAVATLSAITVPASAKGGALPYPVGTVTLTTAAPVGGKLVALSDNQSVASVPSSVLVPAGSRTATFTITTLATSKRVNVTVKATLGTTSKQDTIQVMP